MTVPFLGADGRHGIVGPMHDAEDDLFPLDTDLMLLDAPLEPSDAEMIEELLRAPAQSAAALFHRNRFGL